MFRQLSELWRNYRIKKMLWPKERLLILSVQNGKKPSCSTGITKQTQHLAEKYNLAVRLGYNAYGNTIANKPQRLDISRKEPVSSLPIKQLLASLSDYPQIQDEIILLYDKICDLIIAEALGWLSVYPRLNNERRPFPHNMERPAVAALLGLLYGYRFCCIRYYLETRYFGYKRHREVSVWRGNCYVGVLCDTCERNDPPAL